MAKIEIREVEKIHKALANKRRLAAILYLHAKREANLGTIAEHLRLSYKATSRHLAVLTAADILEKRATLLADVL